MRVGTLQKVAVVIMFILASVALPFTKVSTKRSQELELRQSLRTMRVAIDTFRRDWARDGSMLLGPLCVKNQLTCKEETGITGYPKTLETLFEGLFVLIASSDNAPSCINNR